jgi:integrase
VRLSKALNQAQKRRLISNNPIQLVAKPRVEAKEMNLLSLEEIPQVLDLAKDTEYYSIILTAIHTGMRRNELLGLRWKDVNLDEVVIYLSRSIYRSKGGVTEDQAPKTKSGRRAIDLTPPSVIHLRELWDKQKMDAFFHGYKVTEDGPVFIRTTGDPLLPTTVTLGFKKIVRKLGLDDVRFHDLRHTHATIMLLQGVHPKVVQERLGHSKMSTTMDIYSHVVPSMQKDAVKRFAMALETSK